MTVLRRRGEVPRVERIQRTGEVRDRAQDPRGVPAHDEALGHAAHHDASGFDQRADADGHERIDRRVRSHARVARHRRSARTQMRSASRVWIVDQVHALRDRHAVLDRRQTRDVAVRSDAHAVADGALGSDDRVVPHAAVVADGRVLLDDDVPAGLQAVASAHALVDRGATPDQGVASDLQAAGAPGPARLRAEDHVVLELRACTEAHAGGEPLSVDPRGRRSTRGPLSPHVDKPQGSNRARPLRASAAAR